MSTSPSPVLLTIAQVSKSLPARTGSKSSGLAPSTVVRWVQSGVPARNGERVKLAAVRVGGRWMIRQTDLDAFFEALAATEPTATLPTKKRRTEAQRRRASEAAARELIRRGA